MLSDLHWQHQYAVSLSSNWNSFYIIGTFGIDDDVSQEIVDPHRRLYRDVDVGFTRSHVRDFDEEYGISHHVLLKGNSLMSCPKSSMPM